jgi:hypothetical protein
MNPKRRLRYSWSLELWLDPAFFDVTYARYDGGRWTTVWP